MFVSFLPMTKISYITTTKIYIMNPAQTVKSEVIKLRLVIVDLDNDVLAAGTWD